VRERTQAEGPARPTVEIPPQQTQLRLERIAQLKAELATLRDVPPPPILTQQNAILPTTEPLIRLFEDNDTVSRFKEVFSLGKEDNKKRVLPDVVPGFKASALDLGKCFCHCFLLYQHWYWPVPSTELRLLMACQELV